MREERALIVTMGKPMGYPWWWEQVHKDEGICDLDYYRFVFRDKYAREVRTYELPLLMLSVLRKLYAWRKRYDYIYTIECDLLSFIVGFWQTLMFWRKPRHVVLQFIMREKTGSVGSRLKYLAMDFCFASLHKAVCSSRIETAYYNKVFRWKGEKAIFVSNLTAEEFAEQETRDRGFVFSGGRAFRDFDVFFHALKGVDFETVIIGTEVPDEIGSRQNVTWQYRVPIEEFNRVMSECSVVVVTLEDRRISTGQTVFLQGMALGKPVIVTRTAGSVDYIDHGVDGYLVDPGQPEQIASVLTELMNDAQLRRSVGEKARARVASNNLPKHYSRTVRRAVAID